MVGDFIRSIFWGGRSWGGGPKNFVTKAGKCSHLCEGHRVHDLVSWRTGLLGKELDKNWSLYSTCKTAGVRWWGM
eukprot:1149969-Pelagomonas_calceolata.AAC.5